MQRLPLNNQRCPLCQRNNHCAVNSDTCWCKQLAPASIPPALRELANEMDSAQNSAASSQLARCICKRCLESYHENPKDFTDALAASRLPRTPFDHPDNAP